MNNVLQFPFPQQLCLFKNLPLPETQSELDILNVGDMALISEWDYNDNFLAFYPAVVRQTNSFAITVETDRQILRFIKSTSELTGLAPCLEYGIIDLPKLCVATEKNLKMLDEQKPEWRELIKGMA